VSEPREFQLGSTPLDSGVTLLEASAGTGKTYTISGIVVRLIVIDDLALRSILVVTFTEAATLELRERIRKRLMEIDDELAAGTRKDPVVTAIESAGISTEVARRRIALALASFDEATISTIHGFCQRLLRDNAFEGNAPFEAEVIADASELMLDVAHDFWQQRQRDVSPLVAALAQYADLTPDDGVSLLLRLSRHPQLHILPTATLSSANAMTALAAAGEQIRNAWPREKARLLQLFESHVGISKSNEHGFGSDRLHTLSAAIDSWMATSIMTSDAIEAIDALRSESIEVNRLVSKTAKGLRFPDDEFFDLCSRFSAARQAWTAAMRHEWLQFAADTLPQLKAARGVMTFDDMLSLTKEALCGPHAEALIAAVHGQYRAALIDEFQDTDPLQYEIFRKLFANPPQTLMLIGDPKQSIYGFRGADLFTYLEVHRTLRKSLQPRIYTLRTNYRSSVKVVDAVNHLFSSREKCFRDEEIRFLTARGDGQRAAKHRLVDPSAKSPSPMIMVTVDDGDEIREQIAADIVVEIQRLLTACRLGDRTLAASDIAVLVRSHREAANIEEMLRSVNIPAVRQTQQSVFHSAEADELLRILAAVLEPSNPRLLRTALTAACFGLTAEKLLGLDSDEVTWARWIDLFTRLRDRWYRRGFASMFRELLVHEGLRKELVSQVGGERKLTNLLHLAELAQEAEHHDHLAPPRVIGWIREQQDKDGTSAEQHIQRLDKDDDAIRLVTIHNAKGLEYPVVFCPSHWSSKPVKDILFHERQPPFRMTLDLGEQVDADRKALAAEELLAEDVRLLYVAVTRAVQRCYLYVPAAKESVHSRSALAAVLGADPIAAARALAEKHPEQISVRAAWASSPVPVTSIQKPPELSSRELHRHIDQGLMVGSFSRLIAGAADEQAQDHDDRPSPVSASDSPREEIAAIFRLPGGAATGSALHAVLEHVDFRRAETLPSLVAQYFAPLLLDEAMHAAVRKQLEMLLEHPLSAGDRVVRLADVGLDDRINEAEFYYPIKSFTPRQLAAVCKLGSDKAIPDSIQRLQFNPVEGYLRGFMDLVFRHEGRYYLADWKSNWLGNSTGDYTPAHLDRAMTDNFYNLQSWLYALALERFLSKRLPVYRYEDHFGGIFYIFVRGLDPSATERGVHFARPTPKFLRSLGEVIFDRGSTGNER